ncbi:integrative conjugal element protein [Mycoplasma zalophidermidis]|uniref:Integrative conjugal element protein n=1 Tax=Mycoplasma zalophidermidis TaxID=398174 RepID=A0ABS6DSM4_9MOLU|nr:integrative conjugal element protein [Mycoplasma zalophidermidis]MBU4693424.1 integrative conjugal element protein [Mycoplasma zalophidermidis]
MNYEINIFSNELDLKKYYFNKARELNFAEEEFRNKIRFEKYPDWKIAKQKTHKWITMGGSFELNYTMYEYLDNRGKKRRITYYHDVIIERLKRSKYDFDLIKFCIISDLNNQSLPSELIPLKPSKQLLYEMKKRFKIDEQIDIQNNKKYLENANRFKLRNQKKIHVEIDDLFTRFQGIKYRPKMRVREVILHTNFLSKNAAKKQHQNSSAICYFFTKNLQDKSSKNELTNLENFFNKEFKKLNICRKKTVLKGDGAIWMSDFASKIKVRYSLDYFHLAKKINDTFGFGKFNSKDNKQLYKSWFSTTFGARWVDLFGAIFDKKYALNYRNYETLKQTFLNEAIDLRVDKKYIREAKLLFKYIKNHINNIWNNEGKIVLNESYTEHFVYHSFKKHIKKPNALFSKKHIKTKVIYKNLLRNIATIFNDIG